MRIRAMSKQASACCEQQRAQPLGWALDLLVSSGLRGHSLYRVVAMRHDNNRSRLRAGGIGRGLSEDERARGRVKPESGDGVAEEVGGVDIAAQRRVNRDGDRLRVSAIC